MNSMGERLSTKINYNNITITVLVTITITNTVIVLVIQICIKFKTFVLSHQLSPHCRNFSIYTCN